MPGRAHFGIVRHGNLWYGCVSLDNWCSPMSTASYQAGFYAETTVGGFSDIDGTIRFYVRVNALIQPSFRVVDFGCGRGTHSQDPIAFRRNLRSLKGKVAHVIGLDVDPE